jgi:ribonuclease BN (tRNA processing enzyme)
VRLTVLGSSPSWPNAGGACSGYLVEQDGTALLLDCGSGVLGRLREVRDYADVDAVVVSHLHADHVLDLVVFASALTYGPRRLPAPDLHAPAGAAEALRLLCRGGGMPADHIERAFALREYAPDDVLAVGPLQVAFHPVPHVGPTFAVAVGTPRAGAARLVFGADHGPSDGLVAFARGAGLLLLEATLDRPEPGGQRAHLTPREAGEHAARAGAGRLVLTHRSDELDAGAALAVATEAFAGPVALARPGAIFEL